MKRQISGLGDHVHPNPGPPLVEVDLNDAPRRNDPAEALAHKYASIEIPAEINALQEQRPEIALRWRDDTRWAFTEAIRLGYLITGFVRETRDDQRVGKYLLSKGSLGLFI